MARDLLKRDLAPVLPEALAAVDQEAARVLKLNLAGRQIVDFKGPHGWELAAVNTGRLQILPAGPNDKVHVAIRQSQPLIEVRVPIRLPIMELDSIGRGAANPGFGPVVEAAEQVADAEDGPSSTASPPAGIVGIIPASPHAPHQLPADVNSCRAPSWRRRRRCGRRGSAALTRWCSTRRCTPRCWPPPRTATRWPSASPSR